MVLRLKARESRSSPGLSNTRLQVALTLRYLSANTLQLLTSFKDRQAIRLPVFFSISQGKNPD